MSYMSLARKYRPRRFRDMVGQESSAAALSNAIKLGREPHSILFTGVRGVGKTTIARIYAKALNCESGPIIDPCGDCASCLAIQEGNHEDVLEIDGASNTGIDDIRALQETLGYVPQRSKYKIYIIDEVHMLSTSAFNALLKTLEEPPSHVVFVFATTELSKVPETIQSRCQTFHLRKISRDTIFERLSHILRHEGIPFEESAINMLAKEGRGSLRDALTALDQAIALGGGSVTSDSLANVFGQTDDQQVFEFLRALLKKEPQIILRYISDWDQMGRTMSSLVEGVVRSCRNAMVLRELKNDELNLSILDLDDRQKTQLAEIANEAELLDLNRLFRTWMKCLDDLRHAELDRYVVENYALEWCLDPGMPSVHALMQASSSPHSQALNQTSTAPANKEVPVLKEVATSTSTQQNIPLKDRWKRQTASDLQDKVDQENTAEPLSLQPQAPLPKASDSTIEKAISKAEPMVDHTKATALRESIENSDQATVSRMPGPSPIMNPVHHQLDFPSSWRDLVEEWKKQKPLQARVLEETFVINFGKERIVLAVDPETMAGAKLLQAEARKKVQVQLEQMFGFTGIVEIQPRSSSSLQHEKTLENESLGESLLQTKQREKEVARASLKQQIQEHPITKELISQFGGTIEAIELP